jgi:hypothetical protein
MFRRRRSVISANCTDVLRTSKRLVSSFPTLISTAVHCAELGVEGELAVVVEPLDMKNCQARGPGLCRNSQPLEPRKRFQTSRAMVSFAILGYECIVQCRNPKSITAVGNFRCVAH